MFRFFFKLAKKADNSRLFVLSHFLYRLIRCIFSCDLQPNNKIDITVRFIHTGLGVVINPDAVIGANTRIYQNVTIGGRSNKGAPIIGKNCFIGPGACIIGNVTIGDNVTIGANALVVKDCPSYSVFIAPAAQQLNS